MQRASLCVVVLVLLAGCSGGTGVGGDATPTETTSTATVTEMTEPSTPTPGDGRDGPENQITGTSLTGTMSVDEASASKQQVLEGEPVQINATLSNPNDTVANQTVTVEVGNQTVLSRHFQVEPQETTTVSLIRLNTSAFRPGEKFVTVSTANDSDLFRLDIRPQNELETFINDVRLSSYTLENSTILGPDHVRLTFSTDDDVTELYKGGGSNLMPVPQAAAFEMATSEYAPSKVTVQVPSEYESQPIAYRTSFNKSLATKLYTGEVDAREFRQTLHERATGNEKKLYGPHWTLDTQPKEDRYTFFTGDRARHEYVSNLAERLNNTLYDYLTVDDYGLYNGTQPLPDTTRELGPNASVYITLQMQDPNAQVPYRGFNSTRHGAAVYETAWKLGNMTRFKTYGERPAFVQIRYLWPDGTRHSYVNVPTYKALDAVRRGTTNGVYLPLVLDSPFMTGFTQQRD